ncbi:hypothetical protein OCB72_30200 [Bacillus cereus]|nr:hypothetical protein [Bacillus cereus]
MKTLMAIGLLILSYILFPVFTIQLLQLLLLLIIIIVGFYLLFKLSIWIIAIGIGVLGVIIAFGLISYVLFVLS